MAVSDPDGRVATPLVVLDAAALSADMGPLRRLVADYEVGRLIAGLPLTMSGDEGQQAEVVRATAERLAHAVGLPVSYVDERLSSAQAERAMAETGASSRQRRGKVDMVAASLLLQAYLDADSSRDLERAEND